MLFPYHVDVPMHRLPWMNWVLIGITVLFYPLCIGSEDLTPLGYSLMLGGTSWIGYFGHVLVHAGLVHLLGNMVFLWVFGNAVCAKVGNAIYFLIYFGLAAITGLLAYWIDPRPAVGASGAINGIVGMFLVWYLLNDISVWYFNFAGGETFTVSSFWMILLWLVFDIWGAVRGQGNVGYIAHLVGFGLGFVLALLMTKLDWVEMAKGERNLLDVLAGRR